MARQRMQEQVSTTLHPVYLTRLRGFVDPRSHSTKTHYFYFAEGDDDSLLALILDGCAGRGSDASYAYIVSDRATGPCVAVVL